MLAFVRAAVAAALVLLLSFPGHRRRQAVPARRSRRRRDQARSPDQGRCRPGDKPPPQLRREADAAFQRNDFRTGLQLLGQIVAVAPDDSANWLRLARSRAADPAGQRPRAHALLERAATAAYIAYQRTDNRGEEADSLRDHRRSLRRPHESGGRRSTRCGSRSNCARSPTCARTMRGCARITASACSITRSMPMPPRRAPASSSPRRCRASAPISRRSSRVAGQDKPALSADEQAALRRRPEARRALRHHAARRPAVDRARRRCRSRPTSRSMCATASRWRASPARPTCCRAPASAAFRWSPSTRDAVDARVYRIGDRNLIDTVLGRDFQRNLDRYDIERLTRRARRRRSGRASSRSSTRSTPTSPPRSRSIRRVGELAARRLCDDGASRHGATERRLSMRSRPSGSSSPISA